MIKTHIRDLEPDLHAKALAAFYKLSDGQRGEPESMGGGGRGNPDIFHATGVWTWLSEHVGDITNRIANPNHISMAYGIHMAEPKVLSALRTLQHRYGCAKEIDENLSASIKYEEEKTGSRIDPVAWRVTWITATTRYANAHAKLDVYNEAQFCAREAAIQVGKRDYGLAEMYLVRLAKMMDGADWIEHAGTVYVDNDNIIPYTPKMHQLNETVIRLGQKKSDGQASKFMAEYRAETQSHPMMPPASRLLAVGETGFVIVDLRETFDGDDTIHIADINSLDQRGQGNGSLALKWICALADKYRVTLEGDSKSYMTTTRNVLSQKNLSDWYRRYGFRVDRGGHMIRPPS